MIFNKIGELFMIVGEKLIVTVTTKSWSFLK